MSRKQIPAIEGLFDWPSKDPRLIASKCKTCGTIRFPSGKTCNNPFCDQKDVGKVSLSKKGMVYSYFIEHYQPPPPYHPPKDGFKPYGVGWVELPDGIRVIGMITGCNLEDIKVGMDVELVVESLYENEQGDELMTWKWKAV